MKREKRYCGYAGYYKNIYLRSTLEFIYASYLDFLNRPWFYEHKIFYLQNGESYKPDFYLIDTDEYIEIKGDCYKDEDTKRIEKFKNELNIKVIILVEKDLKELIRNINLNYIKLKNEWKTVAKKENNVKGELNPRYKRKVSESTKLKIKEGVKKAWTNPKIRKSYLDALAKRDFSSLKGILKSKRVTLQCKKCGKDFKVTEAKQSNRSYCGIDCASNTTSHLARKIKAENKNKERTKIKQLINNYVEKNYLDFQNIKYNRLKELLNPLIEYVYTLTGIKDIRSISIAYTGKSVTRKEFINYILIHIENVRRAMENSNP